MINEKIRKAIEESLSSQMSGVLLERLKDLELKETRLEAAGKENATLKENLRLMTIKRDDLKYIINEKAAIAKSRKALDNDQKVFAVDKQVSELKVLMQGEKVNLMNNLVGLLMKNPKAVTFMSTDNVRGITHYNTDGSQSYEPNLGSETRIHTENKKEN